jgi:hypothetical protein
MKVEERKILCGNRRLRLLDPMANELGLLGLYLD